MPFNVKDRIQPTGSLEAEVRASGPELRAFVSLTRFDPTQVLGGAKRYAYLGQHSHLYALRRYELDSHHCDGMTDVHEYELWNRDTIVLADEDVVARILLTWLDSWDDLVFPGDCEAPL